MRVPIGLIRTSGSCMMTWSLVTRMERSTEGAEWIKSASEEFGRLAQGNGTTVTEGMDTIRFIHLKDIPVGKKPTYLKMVVADRPEKVNPKQVRNTIGGDQIQYDGDTSTKAAELNSVISTPKAKCATGELKDFFLQTARMPEKDYAYMMILINVIPPDIINKYNLLDYVVNGKVYVEVSKGIYGLPQAGKLANQQLIRHLEPFGYAPCPHTAGLWTHKTKDISFLLVVDDFAIKYTDRADAEHLLDALKTGYKMSVNWMAKRYCGLIMKWDYNKRTCDISMPGYIDQGNNIQRRRSGISRTVSQWTRCIPIAYSIGRYETSTATYSHANRQQYRRRISQRHHQAEVLQSNEYALVLDRRQNSRQCILEHGKNQWGRLFFKQHPTKHHVEMRPVYFYLPENPVQTYFDNLLDQQANWINAIAATTINVQHKEECSKGVLISHSGLHRHASSDDPHSHVTYVTEQAELVSDPDRCSNHTIMNVVETQHS